MSLPIPPSHSHGSQRTDAATFLRKMSVRVKRFGPSRRRQDPIPTDSRMASTEHVSQKLRKKRRMGTISNACSSDNALGTGDPINQHTVEQYQIPNPVENPLNREGVAVPSSSSTPVINERRETDIETAQKEFDNLTDSLKAKSSSPAVINDRAKVINRRWKTVKEYTRRFTSIPRAQSSPRFQPGQSFSPVESGVTGTKPDRPDGYGLKKAREVGDATVHQLASSEDPRVDELHASPKIQVVDQIELGGDKIPTPIINDGVCLPVASTSRDNTVTQHRLDADVAVQRVCDISDPFKNATPQPRVIPKRAASLTEVFNTRFQMSRFPKSLARYKRKEIPTSPSPMASSVLSGPRLLESIPSEDRNLFHMPEMNLSPVPDRGNQRKSDANDISATHSQTAQESEEIKELRSELRELQRRCEVQSRDLENSNSFLNTADKSSDFDVIRALQKLNAELQQSTTYMADCLVEEFKFQNVTANERASTAPRCSKRIGHVLVDALGTGMSEEIHMLLQIAFQAYLASELCQTISSWTLRSQSNNFIASVYERVCKSESQAVSGRWRVITRGHIKESYITHPESLTKRIIKDLSDILLVTGCTAPQSAIISKITSSFKEKVASLVELAGRLNKIFDDVISSDYEVFIVQPGEKFVDNIMEETDGDQVVAEEGKVLCATHLGLSKQVPVGTLWDQGEKQRMTVLKAKVLLESFLVAE